MILRNASGGFLTELMTTEDPRVVGQGVIFTPDGSMIKGYRPAWQDQGNHSEIRLALVPLDDVNAGRSIVAKTTIGQMVVRHRDEGESHVNVSTVDVARIKAITKAVKRMNRRCGH